MSGVHPGTPASATTVESVVHRETGFIILFAPGGGFIGARPMPDRRACSALAKLVQPRALRGQYCIFWAVLQTPRHGVADDFAREPLAALVIRIRFHPQSLVGASSR